MKAAFSIPLLLLFVGLLLAEATPCAAAAGATETATDSAGVAPDPRATFADANKLYDQGRFKEAGRNYSDLVRSGYCTPTILFNLGNAHFKSGEIGYALAAYRMASRLAPRDPDIRANLQFARNQVQGPSRSASAPVTWLTRLTVNEWTLLAATAFWITMAIALLIQLKPQLTRPLRWPLVSGVVATLLLAGALAAVFSNSTSLRLGFVVAREAPVRQGPLDEQQPAFVLHDGAELEILDQKDDWFQVRTDTRRIGWLRKDQVAELPGA